MTTASNNCSTDPERPSSEPVPHTCLHATSDIEALTFSWAEGSRDGGPGQGIEASRRNAAQAAAASREGRRADP